MSIANEQETRQSKSHIWWWKQKHHWEKALTLINGSSLIKILIAH